MSLKKFEEKLKEQILVYLMEIRKEIAGNDPISMDIKIQENLVLATVYWGHSWDRYNNDNDNVLLATLFNENEDIIWEKVNNIFKKSIPLPVNVLFVKRVPFIEENATHFIVSLNQNLEEALPVVYNWLEA
jgi:acid phosphatase class B